jgi:hypothetical protein
MNAKNSVQSKARLKDSYLLSLVFNIFLAQVGICTLRLIFEPRNPELEQCVALTVGSGIFYVSSATFEWSFRPWLRLLALGVMLGCLHRAFQSFDWAKAHLESLPKTWMLLSSIVLTFEDLPPSIPFDKRQGACTRRELAGILFLSAGLFLAPTTSELRTWWSTLYP